MKRIKLKIQSVMLIAITSSIATSYTHAEAAKNQQLANSGNYTYKSEECGYSVVFPGNPKEKTLHNQKMRHFKQTLFVENDYMLRATCMVFAGDTIFNNMDEKPYITLANDFATQEAISDPIIEYANTSMGHLIIVSGRKTIQDLNFKVKYYLYHHDSVRFTVLGGGLASGYPQNGILQFFKSVHRLSNNES